MKLVRGLQSILPCHQRCVISIGNFDGVHIGHQSLLKALHAKAQELNSPSMLIIFEPHPKEYFSIEKTPARLTSLREKLELLKQYDLDYVLFLRFNEDFASLGAAEFVNTFLIDKLKIRAIVVGEDFRFGLRRQGTIELLRKMFDKKDLQVICVEPMLIDNVRVSSSRIRDALDKDDLTLAKRLLDRPYSMCGKVVYGDERGSNLGFPTANIYCNRHVAPVQGVYAVKIYGLQREPLFGVANLGNRPTAGGGHNILEAHIFEFNENIYGCYIRVEFARKLRDEIHFESFDLLKEQISKDIVRARECFL